MTIVATYPDTEGAVRTWLKGLGIAGVGEHVFFGIPKNAEPPFPLVTVGRIGGGPTRELAPLDNARLSLTVWASTKKEAEDAVRDVISAVEALECADLDASTRAHGGHVDTVLWLPDPQTERPRYIVDVTITAATIPAA